VASIHGPKPASVTAPVSVAVPAAVGGAAVTAAAVAVAPAVVAPAAPAVTAPAAMVEVDKAPDVLKGGTYPESVSLYFDSGKAGLPTDAAAAVAKVVEYAKSGPNTKIGISGFHDATGDPAQNALLAKNRAKAARDLLISAGMPEDRAIMVKPQQMSAGSPDDKQARRVDIYPAQ
jgi:outer membrane protein OmpA-like peptidoglycan-associated protein